MAVQFVEGVLRDLAAGPPSIGVTVFSTFGCYIRDAQCEMEERSAVRDYALESRPMTFDDGTATYSRARMRKAAIEDDRVSTSVRHKEYDLRKGP